MWISLVYVTRYVIVFSAPSRFVADHTHRMLGRVSGREQTVCDGSQRRLVLGNPPHQHHVWASSSMEASYPKGPFFPRFCQPNRHASPPTSAVVPGARLACPSFRVEPRGTHLHEGLQDSHLENQIFCHS